MGARKLSLPVPPSVLSPMLTMTPVLEVEILAPAEPSTEEIRQSVRDAADRMLSASLESLRLEGVTEGQLADFHGAVCLEILVRLLDLDLDEVAMRFVESGGQTLGVSATVAATLIPEVGNFL